MSLITKIASARLSVSTNLFAEREELVEEIRRDTGGLGLAGIKLAAAGLEDPEILEGIKALEEKAKRIHEIDAERKALAMPLPQVVRKAEAEAKACAKAEIKAKTEVKAQALKAALAGLTPRQLPLARSFLRANPDFQDFNRLWKAVERWKSMK